MANSDDAYHTGSEHGSPHTPPEQHSELDPGATPTQRKVFEGNSEKERMTQGSSSTKATATRKGKEVPRMTRAASRARSETVSDDNGPTISNNNVEALLAPLENVFNNRLAAFEKRIIQANHKTMREMMESNDRLIADLKTAQSEVIEESIKNAVASGVEQGLTPLAESLKIIDKNQRIQSDLLTRLASRLAGDRPPSQPSSRPSDRGPGDAGQTASSSSSAAQHKPTEEGDEDDEYIGAGESDDENEEGTKSKRARKATKTKKDLILQENIRKWLNDLIGGQQYGLDVTVTTEEATDFEAVFLRDPVAKPCTIDDFRYYVNGKPSSAWNKGAAFVFVDYVKQNRLMKISDKKTYDLLRKGFMTRIRTLHGYYLKSKFPKDKRDENTKKGRKYGRKSTIFSQRRELLNSLDPLRKYLRYFDLLGVTGMSSDEEEEDMSSTHPKYKVTQPLWRGSDVEDFFRWLDACHVLIRMPNDSPSGARYSQGAPPRFRIRTSQDSENQAYVKGLPKNFYRAEWLEEKEPGWAKGGDGIVNLIIRPTAQKELSFPAELKESLKKSGFVFGR